MFLRPLGFVLPGLLAALLWTPNPIHASVTWTPMGIGTPSGLLAVAIDPSSSSTMYMCSDFGGPYKTTDGGVSWDAITNGIMCEGWYYQSVSGDFLINPDDTDILYKGGYDLFKSTDGGDSWTDIWDSDRRGAVRLGMDTARPDTIYMGTGMGGRAWKDSFFVWSGDGGDNWYRLQDGLPTGLRPLGIEVDPGTHDVFLGSNIGVYYLKQGDTTWTKRSAGLPDSASLYDYFDGHLVGSWPLALSSSGQSLTLYYCADSVYVSTDAGANWASTACTSLPTDSTNYRRIEIHPDYPDTIYVIGCDPYTTYLDKSTDGGANWNALWRGRPYDVGGSSNGGDKTLSSMAIGHNDPDVLLVGRFKSTDGGSNWSCVGGDSLCSGDYWKSKGVQPIPGCAVAVSPTNSDSVYLGFADAGFQDSHDGGTCCRWDTTGMGLKWGGEDCLDIAIDPDSSHIIYASIWHTFGEDANKKGKLFQSTDFGQTWTELHSAGAHRIRSIALGGGTTTTRTIYIGVEDVGVKKSTDSGSSWTNVTNNLGQGGLSGADSRKVTRVIIEPGDDNHVFCAIKMDYTDTSSGRSAPVIGGVWETANGGTSWSRTDTTIVSVHDVAMHPDRHDTLWAAAQDHVRWTTYPSYASVDSGGVYMSPDGGTTWTKKFGNRYAGAVAINPDCPNRVFAGLVDFRPKIWQKEDTVYPGGVSIECGIIMSTNNGNAWTKVNTGLDHGYILRIAHDSKDPRNVYVGTNGGGFFKASDAYDFCNEIPGGGGMAPPSPPRQTRGGIPKVHFLDQNVPNPFNPVTQVTFGLPRAGDVDVSIYNVLGQRVIRLAEGRHDPGVYRVNWDGTNANGRIVASGIYFCRMTAGEFRQTRRLVLMK